MARMGQRSTKFTLLSLPVEVLHRIVGFIIADDDPSLVDRTLLHLRITCPTLYTALSPQALPYFPCATGTNIAISSAPADRVHLSANSITRVGGPGHAFIVFRKLPSRVPLIFWFKLDQFNGHRIDIGVTTNTQQFSSRYSTSFDCFGRANIFGKNITYGRQMQTGDILGIAISMNNNESKQAVQFFDGLKRPIGVKLPVLKNGHPFIHFGNRRGESVSLFNPPSNVPRKLGDISNGNGTKKFDLSVLPYARRLIVSTFEETVWYALEVDWKHTTMKEVFEELSQRINFSVEQIQLRYRGRALKASNITLGNAGIILDEKSGTHAHDLHLGIRHLAS